MLIKQVIVKQVNEKMIIFNDPLEVTTYYLLGIPYKK